MMTTLVIARVILATIFLVAGLAKLADREGARRSLAGFGFPAPLIGPASLLLPFAEIVVAILLVPSSSAAYGALGAVLLLAVFVAGIGVNLARGRRPDCHCFGQLHSEPIGAATVARNSGLLLLALFLVVAGGMGPAPSVLAWAGPLSPIQQAMFCVGIALLALGGLHAALLLRLVRLVGRNNQLLERMTPAITAPVAPAAVPVAPVAGRPVGTTAPGFTLPALDGRSWSLETLRSAGAPVVLFFSDPNCGPCQTLLPEIAEFEQKYSHAITLALVTRGSAEVNRDKIQGRVSRALLQRDREVMEAYGVAGTPTVVLVNADGTIGSALAQGDAEIRQLLAPLVHSLTLPDNQPQAQAEAIHLAPGDDAPEFHLVDLDGEPLTLDRFRHTTRLVLFWNPGCGYCRQMLPDLKAWEAAPDASRARLIVISAGLEEDNRALGLQSPIGIDPGGFTIAQRYGVTGTPSAVLVNPEGRIAAPVAVGGPAILALVGAAATVVPAAAPEPVAPLPSYARPRKERCVHDELLSDGSMILYNGCRNQVMTLNPTAALVWEYCDGDLDITGITAEVREIFPHTADLESDVHAVLQNLLTTGMISPVMSDDSAELARVAPETGSAS